jgi:hypothetical protein
VPTEAQLLHNRTLITQQAAEIALLQAECQERKKALEESEAKLRTAEQALFEIKATIAPIKRVPPEVLGIIFVVHVRDNQQSPWTLMQVSRNWRSAAMMTRTIWGRILFANRRWIKSRGVSPHDRFFDGMEICSKQEQFTRALQRAGATPLDLRVITPGITCPVYSLDKHAVKPRIRSLELITMDDWDISTNLFDGFDFSGIESLTLEDNPTSIVEKVIRESRRLRSLEVPVQVLNKMTGCKWWNELEELTVKFHYFPRNDSIDWLKPALVGTTSLISLSLEDGDLTALFAQEQIRMPSLKYLKLCEVEPFWPIDCCNLTHLTLQESLGRTELADRSIHLPHLIEMVFISLGFGNVLRVFDLPSLNKFDFRGGGGKATNASFFKTLWPTGGSATGTDPVFKREPRVLSLRIIEINSKALSRAIASQTWLEELSTAAVDITADFFDGLVPVQVEVRPKKSQASHRGVAPTWQVGSPSLKRLSIDFVGRKTTRDQVALEAGAKRFMAGRIKAGAPLELLAMRFSEVEGWKELIESV